MKKRAALKRTRPRLPKITEEMKAWSAALGAEVTTWPGVTTRPMFGLTAVYRAAGSSPYCHGPDVWMLPTRSRSNWNQLEFAFELAHSVIPIFQLSACRPHAG